MTEDGRRFGRRAAACEQARAERARRIARNDALFANEDFGEFLREVAQRAGYFSANAVLPGFLAGYNAALRDVVNGLVVNSTRGPAWLCNYAADRSAQRNNEETK